MGEVDRLALQPGVAAFDLEREPLAEVDAAAGQSPRIAARMIGERVHGRAGDAVRRSARRAVIHARS